MTKNKTLIRCKKCGFTREGNLSQLFNGKEYPVCKKVKEFSKDIMKVYDYYANTFTNLFPRVPNFCLDEDNKRQSAWNLGYLAGLKRSTRIIKKGVPKTVLKELKKRKERKEEGY